MDEYPYEVKFNNVYRFRNLRKALEKKIENINLNNCIISLKIIDFNFSNNKKIFNYLFEFLKTYQSSDLITNKQIEKIFIEYSKLSNIIIDSDEILLMDENISHVNINRIEKIKQFEKSAEELEKVILYTLF